MLLQNKGMGGHQSANSLKDEWLTPPDILQTLGQFDLDPCSPVIKPWPTATEHYTIEDNGLVKPWFGRVWCNPPYGNQTGLWLSKLSKHGNGIALIFARTETDMFFKYVWESAHSALFLRGRLYFHHANGQRAAANAGAPSVLVSYGRNNVECLDSCGIKGKHVLLSHTPIIVVGISGTWFQVVTIVVNRLGKKDLKPVYEMVEQIAPDKVERNKHWKEKIRQQIQIIRKNL